MSIDRKEAIAAVLFDSGVWTEEDPRPSEEACHRLAEELIKFLRSAPHPSFCDCEQCRSRWVGVDENGET